jgi:multiple sugar transport system substrate-binding protein
VREGKRYGLPKDWDIIAVFYNADLLTAAGIDPAIMKDWTWNAQDGGTFEETIAKLTLDANGKNGLDPAFDKTNVVQYGFVHQGGGGSRAKLSGACSRSVTASSSPMGRGQPSTTMMIPNWPETLAWYYSLVEKATPQP